MLTKSALISLILCFNMLNPALASDQSSDPIRTQDVIQLHYLMHTSLEIGAFGSTEDAYKIWAKKIIKEIVLQLCKNVDYKFNWSEVAYLEMWWHDKEVDNALK